MSLRVLSSPRSRKKRRLSLAGCTPVARITRTIKSSLPFTLHVDMTKMRMQILVSLHTKDSELDGILQEPRPSKVKLLVRQAKWLLGSPVRSRLWQSLSRRHTSYKFIDQNFYWLLVKKLYGSTRLSRGAVALPGFLDPDHLDGRALTPRGGTACKRVLATLAFTHPGAIFSPALYTITSLFLHYMEEPDAYNCIAAFVMNQQNKLLNSSKATQEVVWRTVLELARRRFRGAFSTLHRLGVTEEQLEEAFQGWLWWVFKALPLTHLVRVLDCLIIEGWKVVLRISLAVFQLFMTRLKREPALVATLGSRGLYHSLLAFCEDCPESSRKLLKHSFGIHGISRHQVASLVNKTKAGMGRREKKNLSKVRPATPVPLEDMKPLLLHIDDSSSTTVAWSWLKPQLEPGTL